MDAKRRRYFHLENADGKRLAYDGILYDEGNQSYPGILWREKRAIVVDTANRIHRSRRRSANLYASINLVLDLVPGIAVLRLEGDAGKNGSD